MNEIKVVNVPLDTSQPEDMLDYIKEKEKRLLACADESAKFARMMLYVDHLDGEGHCIWSLEGH